MNEASRVVSRSGSVMALRQPAVSPFINSRSSLSIVVGKGANPRIISLRPWLTVSLAMVGAILATVYLVASLYWIFRDEMLARLINQQNEMQFTYEDRLASLRNQLDRVTSRQLLDQNSIDGKLHELLARQSQLETRAAIVASLAEQAGLSAPRTAASPARAAPVAAPATTGSINSFAPPARPAPATDAFDLRTPASRGPVPLGPDARPLRQSEFIGAPAGVGVHAARDFTERTERQQADALATIERSVRNRAQRWSSVVTDIGLDPTRFASAVNAPVKVASNQGGPLVPIDVNKPGVSFEQRLASLQFALQQTDRMRRVVSALQLRRAFRSLHALACHAHRHRFPCSNRRSRTGYRKWQGHRGGCGRRLWQHGRDRPRFWTDDALRPSLVNRCRGRSGRAERCRHRQGRLHRPLNRPASAL
jgi:hypothetical protein